MNIDVIENVLQEILNEQKETQKSDKQLANKIEYLSGKLENVEKVINAKKKVDSIDDIKNLEIITQGIENIKQAIAAQEKNLTYERRIIIFPEFKSPECYKLLFNCVLYLTIATYGFLIIRVIVDHWCK
jgi:hypothetical protein